VLVHTTSFALVIAGAVTALGPVSQGGVQQDARTIGTPPEPFAARRDGIERGRLQTAEYDSTTVGVKRRAQVYTPPGYSADRTYPVLYLLHGIGGDEFEWTRSGAADVILDNLYADGKAVPMIVVLPNGRASKDLTGMAASVDAGPRGMVRLVADAYPLGRVKRPTATA
jgi:enterochelin esterase-like enzyme